MADAQSMVAVWKCAALAMIAIGGVGIAALLCAVATSWVIVAERVVSVAIYAATDLSAGAGGDRRRCAAWLLIVVLVAVVRSVRPVGDAFGKVLCFLVIGFVMPRDVCTRRRSAPSLFVGAMYWLSACSDTSVHYGYDEAGPVVRGVYYVVLFRQCADPGVVSRAPHRWAYLPAVISVGGDEAGRHGTEEFDVYLCASTHTPKRHEKWSSVGYVGNRFFMGWNDPNEYQFGLGILADMAGAHGPEELLGLIRSFNWALTDIPKKGDL